MNDPEAKALSDIEKYGCHVLKVLGTEDNPRFTYSIGIERNSRQPELIVTGLQHDIGHWIVNEYNLRIRTGEVFVPNELYFDFLEGFPVMFRPFLKEHYKAYLGWGLWLYEGYDFRTNQLIWPSPQGVWPWDAEATAEYKWLMPILCRPPITS